MIKNLVHFDPFHEIRAFDEMMERLTSGPARPAASWMPADILENAENVLIRVALPGVAPESLEVSVENRVLTIRGEVPALEEPEGTKVYRRELTTGTFSRSFRLPERLNEDAVSATMKHGFVTVTIPKVIEVKPQPRRIEVVSE